MGYSFNQLRAVLRRLGYEMRQGAKHEVWLKVEPNRIRRVMLSRKGSEEVSPNLTSRILKQMGMTRDQLEDIARE